MHGKGREATQKRSVSGAGAHPLEDRGFEDDGTVNRSPSDAMLDVMAA